MIGNLYEIPKKSQDFETLFDCYEPLIILYIGPI